MAQSVTLTDILPIACEDKLLSAVDSLNECQIVEQGEACRFSKAVLPHGAKTRTGSTCCTYGCIALTSNAFALCAGSSESELSVSTGLLLSRVSAAMEESRTEKTGSSSQSMAKQRPRHDG